MRLIFIIILILEVFMTISLPMPAISQEEYITYFPVILKDGVAPPARPVLKWAYGGCVSEECDIGSYSSPVIIDFDNDGDQEVIAAQEHVHFLSGESGQMEYLSYTLTSRAWADVLAGDINHDGHHEIVAADTLGFLVVIAYDPSLTNYQYLWWKQDAEYKPIRGLAASNMDQAGLEEIITVSARAENQWWVYQADGLSYPGDWPQHSNDSPENGYAAGCYNSNIGIADIDNDNSREIIGPSATNTIAVFEENGTQVPVNPLFGLNPDHSPRVWSSIGVFNNHAADLRGYADCSLGDLTANFKYSAPTISDLDNNGSEEIVVIGNLVDTCLEIATSQFYMPFIFNGDRTRWSSQEFNWTELPVPGTSTSPISEDRAIIEEAMPNPVVADLDGDGKKEILYSSNDGKLHAYWLDKTEHGAWPFDVYHVEDGYFQFASEPLVLDFQGDHKSEIIFTTWAQKGSLHWGYLYVLSWDGSLIHQIELPQGNVNVLTWGGGLAAPSLGNIDNDEDLEIVINTAHAGIVAYDLPGTQNANMLWQTGRGNFLRDGSK